MVNLEKKLDNFKTKVESFDSLKELREYLMGEGMVIINELKEIEHIEKRNKYFEKYSNCKHILIYSKMDYDKHEGRKNFSCGCIKCGLDNSVFDYYYSLLTEEEKIKHEYLKENGLNIVGISTGIVCDLDLAQEIYAEITSKNPKIEDQEAAESFKKIMSEKSFTKVLKK